MKTTCGGEKKREGSLQSGAYEAKILKEEEKEEHRGGGEEQG